MTATTLTVTDLRDLYTHLSIRIANETENQDEARYARLDNTYEVERIGRIIGSLETQRAEARASIEAQGGDIYWHR